MGGWRSINKDKIQWDGVIQANSFEGMGSTTTEADPVFEAWKTATPPLYSFTELDPLFMAASGAYNSHIADTTIHFTSGALWTATNLNDTHLTSVSSALSTNVTATTKAQANVDSVSSALSTTNSNVTKAQTNVNSVSSALATNVTATALAETHITSVSSALATNITATTLAETHVSSVSSAVVKAQANSDSVSSAYYAHAGDSSDPHGVTLTQTNLSGTNISGALINVTADFATASAAYVANIVYIATGGNAPTASNYTRGSIYVTYTP